MPADEIEESDLSDMEVQLDVWYVMAGIVCSKGL